MTRPIIAGAIAALVLGSSSSATAFLVQPLSSTTTSTRSLSSTPFLQRSYLRERSLYDSRRDMSVEAAPSMSIEGKKKFKVGIVGATGAVGEELVNCLHRLKFPVKELMLFSSARSAGKVMDTPLGDITIQEFSVAAARQCDFVFLAVDGAFSKENALKLTEGDGPIVIDNSSAWRRNDEVPLVVPEINLETSRGKKLIANPNCTTAIALMALYPLHKEFIVKKCIVSTYQAASGAGAPGMQELLEETKRYCVDGEMPHNKVFAHPLPLNVIPHIDVFQDNLYTKEEMKVAWESRKIMNAPDLAISCTSVRIPTLRAHSEAITIETEKPISAAAAKEILKHAPGLKVVDDPAHNLYPMPLTATGEDDVEVGRIRRSEVFGDYGLDFFVCGDQLLRGAALNAVLIAQGMVKMEAFNTVLEAVEG